MGESAGLLFFGPGKGSFLASGPQLRFVFARLRKIRKVFAPLDSHPMLISSKKNK